MSVAATYSLKLEVRETLTVGVDAASLPVVLHDQLNVSGTLNATSAVPATKHIQDAAVPLAAGVYTIDLTALPGTGGATVDGTGLKVQLIRIHNKGAAAMTFADGVTNGYELLGAAWTITLPPGGAMQFYLPDTAPDIGASAKTIDVTGTGTQTFDLSIVMG
jgi:hypothetical protein